MRFLQIQLQCNIILSGTEEGMRRRKENNRRPHNIQLFPHETKGVLTVGHRDGNEIFLLGISQFAEREKKISARQICFVSPETNLPPEQLRLQISGIWQQADNLEAPGLKLPH